jgi:hypothetical protein
MSEGSKWTPGKIFLLVLGILAGLAIICCGAAYLLIGDKVMAGFAFTRDSAAYILRLQKDYGETALFDMVKNDRAEFVVTIGVEGELTPERVAEVQDGAWKALGEIFGANGFLPVKHLAVGRPVAGGGKKGGSVVDWGQNVVSVEELVRRTGVPAPPLVKFLPEDMENGRVKVKVDVKTGTEDEEDGGGGTGRK